MKTLAWLVLLAWVSGGVFTAAADYLHEDREPTALEQAAFTRLRQKFPGDILDVNLQTFRRLAESPEYLAFLAEAHPDAAPVNAFETIIDFEKISNRILPPKERYLSSYWEQLGVDSVDEITAAEHFLVHFEVTGAWMYRARNEGGDLPNSERTGEFVLSPRTGPRLMATSAAREMLERRFGIPATIKLMPAEWTLIVRYFKMPLSSVAETHLSEDRRWIKAVFEKHGTAEGSLWIALQDPILFNSILYAFTTDETFLASVYSTVDRHQRVRLPPHLRQRDSAPKERSDP